MPTLANLDNDMPDVDPDALTVNLSGKGPDNEDLVKMPKNVQMPEDQQVEEFGMANASSLEDAKTSADETTNEDPSAVWTGVSDKDEEEIREIENLLRKKKSERMRKQKTEAVAQPKKKVDVIVIISSILAVALAGLAIAYFAGLFNSSDSIGMTTEEFAKAYGTTSGYTAISKYGFAFPEISFFDDQNTEATETGATPSDYRNFSGYFENTLNYQFAVRGVVNKSDAKITSMSAMLLMRSSKAFNDSKVVFAPILQVLFPELTIQQSIDLLNQLSANKETVTVRGNYAIVFLTSDTEDPAYGELYIVSKDNADELTSLLATKNTAA